MVKSPELNDFIFVKTRLESKPHQTSGYGGNEGRIIEYLPSCSDEEEWSKKVVKEQIKSTISRMASTDLKDSERIYVVLGFNSTAAIHKKPTTPENITIFDKHAKDIIKNLSATFVAYLNAKHNRLLVSCPLSRLLKVTEKRKAVIRNIIAV